MKRKWVYTIVVIVIMFASARALQRESEYDRYRNWFDKSIAALNNQSLEHTNQLIRQKKIQAVDYQHLALTYKKLLADADRFNASNQAHPHLLLYLESRMKYYDRYAEYFRTKDQMEKALLNNIYDEGNIEYSLFLDELQKWAVSQKETYNYPFGLY